MKVVIGICVVLVIWSSVLFSVIRYAESVEGMNIWKDWEYDPGPWCERERTTEFVREPANAYSDFSFLLVAFIMIMFGVVDMTDKKKKIKNSFIANYPVISILCGVSNIIHAVGTFWNHSCRCQKGHQLDVAGMSLVIAFNFLFFAYRWFCYSRLGYFFDLYCVKKRVMPWMTQIGFAIIVVITLIVLWPISDLRYAENSVHTTETFIVAFLVSITFLTLLLFSYFYSNRIKQSFTYVVLATICLLSAIKLHKDDMERVNCDPDSLLQGHAIWHVATSFSLLFLYLFFRSERSIPQYSKIE